MALLEVRNLSVDFRTLSGSFRAVDGLDMTVNAGEVLAIVGESGSGKSVAMLALMDLLPETATVTADVMRFDGRDLQKMHSRERRRMAGDDMAMVFQEATSSLHPFLTVGFQLKEVLWVHSELDAGQRDARAVELFEMVGIPAPRERLKAFPHQLSGGMNQRVMIAMAIACGPKLLVADEPTTALDVTIQAQILELLGNLQKTTGMALVLITHDLGIVAEMAQRVQVQYAGSAVEQQPVDALFQKPRHPYTEALLAAMPDRATTRRLQTIPGSPPGRSDRTNGCAYAPRCPYEDGTTCREVKPVVQGAEGCWFRCSYPR